jgi:hypothetical protein
MTNRTSQINPFSVFDIRRQTQRLIVLSLRIAQEIGCNGANRTAQHSEHRHAGYKPLLIHCFLQTTYRLFYAYAGIFFSATLFRG